MMTTDGWTSGPEFCLDDGFIDGFVGRQPDWGPLGYVTYKRTYARSLDSVPRRIAELADRHGLHGSEEWWLTLVRVVDGTYGVQERHCRSLNLPWDQTKAQESAQEMYGLMWDFKFLPPGRGLWMMGTDYVTRAGGACLNNCSFISTDGIDRDFSEPFCFLMDMSMLGVGVGGDTLGAGKVIVVQPSSSGPYVVHDSREGWVDLIRRVLDSFVGRCPFPSPVDYTNVRPAGSPIKGFGGTASGPGPLRELVDGLQRLLSSCVGRTLSSVDIVDIFNLIGRCVVAGNVRRSAEIMFGDPNDQQFLDLKNPLVNGDALRSHRWVSNNSVVVQVGQDYSTVAERTARNGEPGYLWLDNARRYGRMGRPPDRADMRVMGANPCVEQSLESAELCCLVETFPSRHSSFDEYRRTLKFAYLYAKTVTLIPTHNRLTNAVMLRNRRIGTSQSGIVQAMKKFGRRVYFTWCDRGYSYLRDLDRIYSHWLCIPMSVKVTSVKPSGTVSLLPGVTPGIHYPHSEYYWRVVRFESSSYIVAKLRAAGYRCVELMNEPNTTAVYFAVKEMYYSRCEDDVTMWEQLENAAQVQEHWADNQVSVTVKFDRDVEGRQICEALELYETRLKGVSFLPRADHGYEHAPYQKIDRETYEAYVANLRLYDLNESQNEVVDKFCDGDRCVV